MRITLNINGREFSSVNKPKMKHLRMGGRLIALQEQTAGEPRKMYEYLDEIYAYIKDTFPEMQDEDIDCMATEDFLNLVADISRWANGGGGKSQKKT